MNPNCELRNDISLYFAKIATQESDSDIFHITMRREVISTLVLFTLCRLRVFAKKYAARPNQKLVSTYVLEELQGLSKMECVASCSARSWCLGASWGSNLRLCRLTNENCAVLWDLRGEWPKLEEDDGWVKYGEILYPVAEYRSGRYIYTFNDAKQICITQAGTRLATVEEMLSAKAMGMHICNCGWIANGRNGLVLQAPKNLCPHYPDATGIAYCDKALANAWCMIK